MAIPGDKCNRCDFCDKELADELHVFCPIARKDPSENNCWCVCYECKDKFMRQLGSDLK